MNTTDPFHIVLVEPEIPPNTGNIARLCAATHTRLHLVQPLGFSLDEKHLRRAGMDYWERVQWQLWSDWEALSPNIPADRLHLFTTKATCSHWDAVFQPGDWLVFGRETRGLPESLLARYADRCLRIPMAEEERSLNLGTSAGIALYEALRQTRPRP